MDAMPNVESQSSTLRPDTGGGGYRLNYRTGVGATAGATYGTMTELLYEATRLLRLHGITLHAEAATAAGVPVTFDWLRRMADAESAA